VPEVCDGAALWFDPDQPATLAEALSRLIEEDGLLDGLRQAGLDRARHFTWEAAARALLARIEGLRA
jgi:glycosyltransferase involved in cell wall biosynthesis